jgi:sugar/nucleoside kinase (ribokinase family)
VQGAGGAAGAAGDDLDVVGLGALNVDLIATPAVDAPGRFSDLEDNETLAHPREIRRRIAVDELDPRAYLGGSAFNAIAMLASLGSGLRPGMVGISTEAIDKDGHRHVDRMRELGIADVTRRSGGRPGWCLALTEGNQRRLYTSPEANLDIADYLRSDARPRGVVARARVLHLTSLLEDPDEPGSGEVAEAVADFVETVKADNPGLLLSFDPGRTWVDGLGVLDDLHRVYALADVLYVSPDEYATLSGHPYADGAREAPLLGLCSTGTRVIVKPMDEIVVRYASGFEMTRVPRTDRTAAVDPTGAGDAVAAGMLAAYGAGAGIVQGCRLGLWIAARRVSAHGDGGHRRLRHAAGRFPWLPARPVGPSGYDHSS